MIKKTLKRSNFTTIANEVARDQRISLKARGLLLFILSYPPNWNISVKWLIRETGNFHGEGRTGITDCLRELEQAGYIFKQDERDKNGRYSGVSYVVFDVPQNSEGEREKSQKSSTDCSFTDCSFTAHGKTEPIINKVLKEKNKSKENNNPPYSPPKGETDDPLFLEDDFSKEETLQPKTHRLETEEVPTENSFSATEVLNSINRLKQELVDEGDLWAATPPFQKGDSEVSKPTKRTKPRPRQKERLEIEDNLRSEYEPIREVFNELKAVHWGFCECLDRKRLELLKWRIFEYKDRFLEIFKRAIEAAKVDSWWGKMDRRLTIDSILKALPQLSERFLTTSDGRVVGDEEAAEMTLELTRLKALSRLDMENC